MVEISNVSEHPTDPTLDPPLLDSKGEGEYVMSMQANFGSNMPTASENRIASSIRRKIPQRSPSPAHCCIFRSPNILRSYNEKAFVPNLVSIGPFHHGQAKLRTMEEMKLWYLHGLLDRKPTPETSLEYFVKEIKEMEQYCRDCYDEKIDVDSDKFVEMMVVDGCFMIEIFRKCRGEVPEGKDDPIAHAKWIVSALTKDFLLLENQIPWKVVDCLFELTKDIDNEKWSRLSHLTIHFFSFDALALNPQVNEELVNNHLLDFIRNCLLGSYAQITIPANRWQPIPSVTELLQAGVKFKCGNQDDMLNITFQNGVMEIPPIKVQEGGESLLRNLITYEQCGKGSDNRIVSYAILLDDLINSSKDVEFLVQIGILQIFMSTEDTSCIFNRLSNDTLVSNFSYKKLVKEVNAYHQGRWHRWQTILRRDYFSNPWSILSFAAALLILGFTFAQTIYSAVSYYKKK